MAKVTSESLPWLSKPSTGYDLFAKRAESSISYPNLSEDRNGALPHRLIARRDTEIFVGRGNEVRCADLQDLKARHPMFNVVVNESRKLGYREHKVLDLPDVDFDIHQLEVSNDRLFLAIVGEKELAVCVLPGEGFLKRNETKMVVPHYHRVGTGYHNADGSNIVRVLWHPLGVEGASLIVLTADGFVRTYDFTIGVELSFEVPDQTFDLFELSSRKRVTGGFAADEGELEPAACCFGAGEQGWRPFTLYILMRNGDVYALCPVVPSRWMAPREYLRTLSMTVAADLEDLGPNVSWERKAAVRQQTKWINHVLNQQTDLANAFSSLSLSPRQNSTTCLTRPEVVGPSPVLQGPFLFDPEPPELPTDDDYSACDIFHVDADIFGLIGILYSHGKLDVCLEYEPLDARWVDKKRKSKPEQKSTEDLPVVACFETTNLGLQAGPDSAFTNWPVFIQDPRSEQLWYIYHATGVISFSMEPWMSKLETVLDGEGPDEPGFFMKVQEKNPSRVQSVINTKGKSVAMDPIVGAVALYEAYTGYILLAASANEVYSVEFDQPIGDIDAAPDETFILQPSSSLQPFHQKDATPRTAFGSPRATQMSQALTPQQQQKSQSRSPVVTGASTPSEAESILRPAYTGAEEFARPSSLPALLRQEKSRNPKLLSAPMVFSTETSNILRRARDTLKAEFDALMTAAQDMHDRASAQRVEYEKQLETILAASKRLDAVRAKNVRERLERYIQRQQQLEARADELLRALVINNQKGLSDAEKKWFKEVNKMHERVTGDSTAAFARRKDEVRSMVAELCPEAEAEMLPAGSSAERSDGVPEELRQGKLKQLRMLLDRENSLVTATRKKLEALELEADRLA